MSAGPIKSDASSFKSIDTRESYIGRLVYSYENRYLLTLNGRADASSRFGPDNRWGYFGSVSVGWRISGEGFMQDLEQISDLKLRLSLGSVGTDPSNKYPWQATYGSGYNYPLNGAIQAGYYLGSTMPNSSLQWELTKQYNAGIDFGLFKNRIVMNADVYYKLTSNLLYSVPLPMSTGFSNSFQNLDALISNKGFELLINSRNFVRDFGWRTNLSFTMNRNNVDDLANLEPIATGLYPKNMTDRTNRVMEGQPLGVFYGYIAEGVDPATGDMIFTDLNENGSIDPGDRGVIGDPNPDFEFALGNTFNYKEFELSILLQGTYGNDIINVSNFPLLSAFDHSNMLTKVLNAWQNVGDIADIPRLITKDPNKNFKRTSSFYVEDGSYIRVKNISLAYYLDDQIAERLHIGSMKFYLSIDNALTFTNYSGLDPEVNASGNSATSAGIDYFNYPQTRSFSLGVNVEF